MAPIIEPIGKPLELGEGPFWDSESQSLYFVDIITQSVHRYDTKTKEHFSAKTEKHCSLIIKVEGQKNKFIINQINDLKIITWDGVSDKIESYEHLVNIKSNEDEIKLNDGKVDSKGRLWAGTISPQIKNPAPGLLFDFEEEKAALYKISKDKKVTTQLTKITLSNGLAWSSDDKKFYFVDSLKYSIFSYDYDSETGILSNEKNVFHFKENNREGFPDGMTIDVEGKLWVASFGDGMVLQIDPTNGKLLSSIKLPTPNITSVCFGGSNYDELYVTTGSAFLSDEQLAQYPESGRCLKVTNLGVKGVLSLPMKL